MKLTVQGIEDQQPIPETFAFGVPGDGEPMTLGPNRNPALHWTCLLYTSPSPRD